MFPGDITKFRATLRTAPAFSTFGWRSRIEPDSPRFTDCDVFLVVAMVFHDGEFWCFLVSSGGQIGWTNFDNLREA